MKEYTIMLSKQGLLKKIESRRLRKVKLVFSDDFNELRKEFWSIDGDFRINDGLLNLESGRLILKNIKKTIIYIR